MIPLILMCIIGIYILGFILQNHELILVAFGASLGILFMLTTEEDTKE